ncbi:MAG TPA: hypothetical protein VKT29_05570 [Terriglobales bacterium]|nr:hypothetical protein [Terriglobales bacterium]
MKDYLAIWAKELLQRESMELSAPVRVIGERKERLGPGLFEVARVQLMVHPAPSFAVEDVVAEKGELERLHIPWPDTPIFGLLDVLLLTEPTPLYRVRVVLEKVWYHETDSNQSAFHHAGRDAGQKILDRILVHRIHGSDYQVT